MTRHPIAVFVLVVLAVVGIGVGVLVGVNSDGLGPLDSVRGSFFLEGGPIRPDKEPAAGPVTLTDKAGATFATTSNDGKWSIVVPPGTYTVYGYSLQWRCQAGNPVHVSVGSPVTGIIIICPLI